MWAVLAQPGVFDRGSQRHGARRLSTESSVVNWPGVTVQFETVVKQLHHLGRSEAEHVVRPERTERKRGVARVHRAGHGRHDRRVLTGPANHDLVAGSGVAAVQHLKR